ncbi:uncharacterized protein EI97DRAFT_485249, partial [Westerdykella ornata]
STTFINTATVDCDTVYIIYPTHTERNLTSTAAVFDIPIAMARTILRYPGNLKFWRFKFSNITPISKKHNQPKNKEKAPGHPPEQLRSAPVPENQASNSRISLVTTSTEFTDLTAGESTSARSLSLRQEMRNEERNPTSAHLDRGLIKIPEIPESALGLDFEQGTLGSWAVLHPKPDPRTTLHSPSQLHLDSSTRETSAQTQNSAPEASRPSSQGPTSAATHTTPKPRRPKTLHRIYSRYGVSLYQPAGPSGSRPGRHDHPGARSNPNIAEPDVKPYIYSPSPPSQPSPALRRSNAVRYPTLRAQYDGARSATVSDPSDEEDTMDMDLAGLRWVRMYYMSSGEDENERRGSILE